MRRTLALLLALPLTLVTLAAMSTPDAPARSAAASSVPGPPPTPTAVAAPEPRPVPVTTPTADSADPDATGSAAAGPGGGAAAAESTVAEAPASDEGPTASSAPTDGPGGTAPVETTFLMASVPDAGAIAGTGRRWRYTVEVEPGLGIDPDAFAAEVRAALTDDRSWARTRTLEQVDDPAQARIRVVLATPDTVDELCGRVGLATAGIYSCWNGRFAALNSWRWEFGADGFPDITTYRNYLVNHEFGHGLGYGHVGCPAAGALAPVMMQQSKRLGGCVANGWPYP
jgi:hypothetical protein